MSLEGLGQRSSGDRVENRCFDFEILTIVEKPPQLANNDAALDKHFANFAIDNKIDVALAVTDFNVSQSMPLLRQRQETLGQKCQLARKHSQLARFRAKQHSFDADEVADIEQFVQLKIAFGQAIFLYVRLKLAFAVG